MDVSENNFNKNRPNCLLGPILLNYSLPAYCNFLNKKQPVTNAKLSENSYKIKLVVSVSIQFNTSFSVNMDS